MTLFTRTVVAIIQSIPEAKIMTYGQIAALAGSPRAARQVVRILHSMSRKHRLPWHRVVNSQGIIGMTDDESFEMQSFLLQAEGVQIANGRHISLEQYQFHPDQTAR